jgi:hypothetical protein
MIDWYMLLTPLVVLPIALLFVFVGCGLEDSGTNEGLTVRLRWKFDLGPDIVQITGSATITSDSVGNAKEKFSPIINSPSSIHEGSALAIQSLWIQFGNQIPKEFIFCDIKCGLFNTSDAIDLSNASYLSNAKFKVFGGWQGTIGGDGHTLVFELRPHPDQDPPFDIIFTGEISQ